MGVDRAAKPKRVFKMQNNRNGVKRSLPLIAKMYFLLVVPAEEQPLKADSRLLEIQSRA